MVIFFCCENGFDDIAINVTSFEKLLELASDILDISPQDISVFLFEDGTLIDNNDYLETLPAWTPLFICKPTQKEKPFNIKRATAECQSRWKCIWLSVENI